VIELEIFVSKLLTVYALPSRTITPGESNGVGCNVCVCVCVCV
jgi:hypothetical protein